MLPLQWRGGWGLSFETVPRYWTAVFPASDYTHTPWGEDGPNREGKMMRFRRLAVSRRARQALIDTGLFTEKAFQPFRSVATPEAGVVMLDRRHDPVPPMFYTGRAGGAACRGAATLRGRGPPKGGCVRGNDVELRREDLASAVASALIAALNAELTERYPEEGANHVQLDAEEVAEGRGAFLVAYVDGRPLGCGAVRRLDPQTAEIKRMYVDPAARGRGVGRRVLAALEVEARRLGARRLVLETGERQPESLALYARAGFTRIPLFGEYVGSPLSVCMEKAL
jgi:GNAT superfamily N-acetyltransferase